ncbi:SRPBCC family protein, partial [Streptomyces violaceoruber]
MSSLAVTANSHSSAPAALVYAALVDAESWPSWTSYYEVEWEFPAGVERPARVGDRRTIRSPFGRVCCREHIVEMIPDQRFSYDQAAGLFTSHRGSVDLARAPRG